MNFILSEWQILESLMLAIQKNGITFSSRMQGMKCEPFNNAKWTLIHKGRLNYWWGLYITLWNEEVHLALWYLSLTMHLMKLSKSCIRKPLLLLEKTFFIIEQSLDICTWTMFENKKIRNTRTFHWKIWNPINLITAWTFFFSFSPQASSLQTTLFSVYNLNLTAIEHPSCPRYYIILFDTNEKP